MQLRHFIALPILILGLGFIWGTNSVNSQPPVTDAKPVLPDHIKPFMDKYCISCHSAEEPKGELNLEQLTTLEAVHKALPSLPGVVDAIATHVMPPKKSPQPAEAERVKVVETLRGIMTAEAKKHAGDPGRVVVRRLSNAEYDNTIRDLTGIDLKPARDFPVDGAAGEGFTNAGDALVISPALLNKYLAAAKEISSHAVLLPDGIRFSNAITKRDRTNEAVAAIKAFYAQYTPDGKLPIRPYLLAAIRHREELLAGKITTTAVAARERLNSQYLTFLYTALADTTPSFPLDRIRAQWRKSTPANADVLVAEVATWQSLLWRFVPIGSYRDNNTVRQLANQPIIPVAPPLRAQPKATALQDEVTIYLSANELTGQKNGDNVLWRNPRFEGKGLETLLLKDYAAFGPRYEIDYRAAFADSAQYLQGAAAIAANLRVTIVERAQQHHLDADLLAKWVEYLSLESLPTEGALPSQPAAALTLLTDKTVPGPNSGVGGWAPNQGDLPAVISNSSDRVELVPGTMAAHSVAVHPAPTEFAAISWISPIAGKFQVTANIAHIHPACGNGVSWRLEYRKGDRAHVLDAGLINLGKSSAPAARELAIAKGESIVLIVDARDGEHTCDLTRVQLTLTELDKPNRVWNLAQDVADNIRDANPHSDKHGNPSVWSFARGKTKDLTVATRRFVGSKLDQFCTAARNPKRQAELPDLALAVQSLLTGPHPEKEKAPDTSLYDSLLSPASPLLKNIITAKLPQFKHAHPFGVEVKRFTGADLNAAAGEVLAIHLPAVLLRDREFIVDPIIGKTDGTIYQFEVSTSPPKPAANLNPTSPLAGNPTQMQLAGLGSFRNCFPSFICYARVIPDDEVVSLKLYHREDAELARLFLNPAECRSLDRLWADLTYLSEQPITEADYLPQFIGYVSQDGGAKALAFYKALQAPFNKRADDYKAEMTAAIPGQLAALAGLAARAYRRPLSENEQVELRALYTRLRKSGSSHDEAFRSTLTRVLVSPSFLFKIERSAPGLAESPVSQWELATRLSYFLWASAPDAELIQLAAAGKLHVPEVLNAQVKRMLLDPRIRGLATEFGTQWLHVRDFRGNREKNEKLFPTFNDALRDALYEESVLFFNDLFQADRAVVDIINSDHTFLNDLLAKHYGIPGIAGAQWRRVGGVNAHGRGGVLGLGSVLASQSGASRTSPVLRGNWVIEVILGEKLPRPPANVPRLPEEEGTNEGTVREITQKHTRLAECAGCHRRIDPIGFALEKYDPIGRYRERDLGNRPIDAKAKTSDGMEFEGLDGLRSYVLNQRRRDFDNHFCQKLLGYALGRSVILSDRPLLDELVASMGKNDLPISELVKKVVLSKQFRYHRGLESTRDE